MKIEINGNEKPEGYEVTIEMNGSIKAIYVSNMIKVFLAGVASHGTNAELAVVDGITDFMQSLNEKYGYKD